MYRPAAPATGPSAHPELVTGWPAPAPPAFPAAVSILQPVQDERNPLAALPPVLGPARRGPLMPNPADSSQCYWLESA